MEKVAAGKYIKTARAAAPDLYALIICYPPIGCLKLGIRFRRTLAVSPKEISPHGEAEGPGGSGQILYD
jgi:hypothetical protein